MGVFVDAEDAVIADAIEAGRAGSGAAPRRGDPAAGRRGQERASACRSGKCCRSPPGAMSGLPPPTLDVADFILFDAKTPKGALPGGMGLAFDWSLLALYRGATPWGVAGGLTPDNVAEAIAVSRNAAGRYLIGRRKRAGIKDPGKDRRILRRRARIEKGRPVAGPPLIRAAELQRRSEVHANAAHHGVEVAAAHPIVAIFGLDVDAATQVLLDAGACIPGFVEAGSGLGRDTAGRVDLGRFTGIEAERALARRTETFAPLARILSAETSAPTKAELPRSQS